MKKNKKTNAPIEESEIYGFSRELIIGYEEPPIPPGPPPSIN